MKDYTFKEKADYYMKKQNLAIVEKKYKEGLSFGNSASIYLDLESKRLKKELSSRVQLDISKDEVNDLTSVLIDVLDYYSSLPNRQEQMKLLVNATSVCNKLSKAYYELA